MKIIMFTVGLLAASLSGAHSAEQQREYNTWHKKNGVLYGMTQTAEHEPVLVSIGNAGFESANMVVSYTRRGNCDDAGRNAKLEIDGKIVPAEYRCFQLKDKILEHFVIAEATQANYVVERLTSDFTVLLQKDIKLWAANVKSPKFGVGPRL